MNHLKKLIFQFNGLSIEYPGWKIYATETYDMFRSNTNAVYAATTVDEIAQIDVKANYPKFLTFELNLDLWNGSNNTETIN